MIGLEWYHTVRTTGEELICPLDSHQEEWEASQRGPTEISPGLLATPPVSGRVTLSHRPPTSGEMLPHHHSGHISKALTR